jgi:hypothetical protein
MLPAGFNRVKNAARYVWGRRGLFSGDLSGCQNGTIIIFSPFRLGRRLDGYFYPIRDSVRRKAYLWNIKSRIDHRASLLHFRPVLDCTTVFLMKLKLKSHGPYSGSAVNPILLILLPSMLSWLIA